MDDGSPDNCPALCDEYAQKDARMKVIHKKNEGLGVDRDAGLNLASGKFVSFLDSDDWVAPAMSETLYRVAEKMKGEMCIRDRCINAVSRRNTVFSDMNDLGSLFQPNPLFISSNIRSLPPRLL